MEDTLSELYVGIPAQNKGVTLRHLALPMVKHSNSLQGWVDLVWLYLRGQTSRSRTSGGE